MESGMSLMKETEKWKESQQPSVVDFGMIISYFAKAFLIIAWQMRL